MHYISFAKLRGFSYKKNVFSRYCTINPRLMPNADFRLCREAEEFAHQPHQCDTGLSPPFEPLHYFQNLPLIHVRLSTYLRIELGPGGTCLLWSVSNHLLDCTEENPRTPVIKLSVLDSLEKLRKATVSFVMSACPSVHAQELGSHQ
jgi:hypothetical protein